MIRAIGRWRAHAEAAASDRQGVRRDRDLRPSRRESPPSKLVDGECNFGWRCMDYVSASDSGFADVVAGWPPTDATNRSAWR